MKKKISLLTSSCVILSLGSMIPEGYGSAPFQPVEEGDYPEPKRVLTASQFVRGKEGLNPTQIFEASETYLLPGEEEKQEPKKGITVSQLFSAKGALKAIPSREEKVKKETPVEKKTFLITPEELLMKWLNLKQVSEDKKNSFTNRKWENKILYGDKPSDPAVRRQQLNEDIKQGAELKPAAQPHKLAYDPKNFEARDEFFREEFLKDELKQLDNILEEIKQFKEKIDKINNSQDKNGLPKARLELQEVEKIQELHKKQNLSILEKIELEKLMERQGEFLLEDSSFETNLNLLLTKSREKVEGLTKQLKSSNEKLKELEADKKSLLSQREEARERWKGFLSYLKLLGEKRGISEISTEDKETYYDMYMNPQMSLMTPEKGWEFMKKEELKKAFAAQAEKRRKEEERGSGWEEDNTNLSSSWKDKNEIPLSASPESSVSSLVQQDEGEEKLPPRDPASPLVPNDVLQNDVSEHPDNVENSVVSKRSATPETTSSSTASPQPRGWFGWFGWGS